MSETIVIRSRKQPYVGFGILLVPMIALQLYLVIYKGNMSCASAAVIQTLILVLIWWYLSTFKLILTEDAIVYKELWRSARTPIDMVSSVEPGKLFGVSGTWIIHRRDNASTMLVKVANFSPSDLRRFAQAVIERDSRIEFTALSLGRKSKAS
jgi:hypothetical protein